MTHPRIEPEAETFLTFKSLNGKMVVVSDVEMLLYIPLRQRRGTLITTTVEKNNHML